MKKNKLILPILLGVLSALIFTAVVFGLMYFFQFASPNWFYTLIVISFLVFWYTLKRETKEGQLVLSNFKAISATKSGDFYKVLKHIPFVFQTAGLSLLIIALARPQLNEEFWETTTIEGIEIVLALDLSGSMLSRDFNPNRLEASKEVAIDFIKRRKNDKIGLVIYEGEAFLQCPTTTDHNTLIRLFNEAKSGKVKGGTAIGAGLATSLNAIKNSDSKSKTVILLTDGVNQDDQSISPLTAADIAAALGVRVYTIGVGTIGTALTPVAYDRSGGYIFEERPVKIDEDLLKEIASRTNGTYFRATDKDNLKNIYKEIDKLEKSRQRITEHSNLPEKFYPFLMVGAILIILSLLLKKLVLKSINS